MNSMKKGEGFGKGRGKIASTRAKQVGSGNQHRGHYSKKTGQYLRRDCGRGRRSRGGGLVIEHAGGVPVVFSNCIAAREAAGFR